MSAATRRLAAGTTSGGARRMRRTGVGSLCAAIVAVAVGCRSQAERDAEVANGDDPIAALAVTVPSTRYTTRYWVTQAELDPTRWAEGQAYCDRHRAAADGEKPNCAAVVAARFELAGRRTRPRPSAGQHVDSLLFRP